MKNKGFLPLLVAFAMGTVATAQVNVQPVKDVHTVVIEDAVSLKVYIDEERGTELEVSSNTPVAKVSQKIMTMDGATKAVLRLAPDSPITHFRVEDAATLEFVGPMDFGDRQFTINAEDAGKVKMTKMSPTDTIRTGYVILHAEDGARIVGDVPLLLTAYTLHSEDNAYIELPSIHIKPGTATDDKTYEMIQNDNGKIKVLGYVGYLNLKLSDGQTTDGSWEEPKKRNSLPDRDLELSWCWGFDNWGGTPFAGFGGIKGDAEASYKFKHYEAALNYPVFNRRHFGIYAGLGLEGNSFYFTNPLVNYNGTGFETATSSNLITPAGATLDNWKSDFWTMHLAVPITFSIEPWQYNKFCLRLTAIPGILLIGDLTQVYESNTYNCTIADKRITKQINPFMLDARLALYYKNIGVYAQVATLPALKSGNEKLYPVMFGFSWVMTGR